MCSCILGGLQRRKAGWGVEGRGGRGGGEGLLPRPCPQRASPSCNLELRPPGHSAGRNLLMKELVSCFSSYKHSGEHLERVSLQAAQNAENNRLPPRIPPPARSPPPAGLRLPRTFTHQLHSPGAAGWGRGGLTPGNLHRGPQPPLPHRVPEEGSDSLNPIRTPCPRDLFPTRTKYLWFEKVKVFFSPAPWDSQCNAVTS